MHAPNGHTTPIEPPGKVYGSGDATCFLSDNEVADAMRTGLNLIAVDGRRVLLIVPNGTRTLYLNDVRRTLSVKQMETFNLSPFTTKIRRALLPSHVFAPAGIGGLIQDRLCFVSRLGSLTSGESSTFLVIWMSHICNR